MNIKTSFCMFAGALAFGLHASADPIQVATPHTAMVLDTIGGGELKQLYYGDRLRRPPDSIRLGRPDERRRRGIRGVSRLWNELPKRNSTVSKAR